MIWSSTNAGRITYASAEWATYTGQSVDDALGEGWLRMLHPEDRDATAQFFEKACASIAPFTVGYRLRRTDGTFRWVVVGAAPSLSLIDGTFLGYLGAISEDNETSKWSGIFGTSAPRQPSAATMPHKPVDVVADHLLLARSMAVANGEERLLASIDFAPSEVMRRLGYSGTTGATH